MFLAGMKKPGGPCGTTGLSKHLRALDHAKDNGADKGEGQIGRPHAQPVDESHGKAPLVYVTARINV